MVCQECSECEYPNTFGCFNRDYDCDDSCNFCEEDDECKYESGDLGALVYAFNKLVEEGKCNCHPMIGGGRYV